MKFGDPTQDNLFKSPNDQNTTFRNFANRLHSPDQLGGLESLHNKQTQGEFVGDQNGYRCTGCKSRESNAVGHCLDCSNYLCPNCVMAHQFMHCFEGHRVLNVADTKDSTSISGGNDAANCVFNHIIFTRACIYYYIILYKK